MIGSVRLEFHLPGCHSLKEKRSALKRFLEHIRREFGVAAAEVDEQDRWQSAVVEAAVVGNERAHLHSVLTRVVSEAERPSEMILTRCEMNV
jgi:uncharacterized protein YlxP (DUF503 family)